MSEVTSALERFQILKAKIARHERIAGTYILEAAEAPNWIENSDQHKSFYRQFASRLGFSEPDIGDEEWKQAEVFKEEACDKIIAALIGGAEIGHSRWDVEPEDARKLAAEFLALCNDRARFFCDTFPSRQAQGFGPDRQHEYIFGGGCVAVDEEFVGVFWVLDND